MSNFRLVLPLAVATTALTLPAQYNEVGDAGQLPRSAQVIPFVYPGALPSISGTLTSGDVDMYLLYIADPATFTASTAGTTWDTQLFLFFPDGRGVTHNDDAVGATSAIGGVNVPHPGYYYLAVSGYNTDPTAAGGLIWNNTPFTGDRRPDGARRRESVSAWGGTTGANGAYTIALTGCLQPEKEVVAPDFQHLSESTTQTGPVGSTSWWRAAGGRFQVLIEASHFTSAGYAGGFIDELMFRGESGEPNLGGQQWANVQVQLARTSATATTLTNDFAANLAASAGVASTTFATVTVGPSTGSTPNNYNINLPLTAIGGYSYSTASGNLLVDVTMPTAATIPPTSGPVMALEDTTGTAAVVRGIGVTAAVGAATGTLTAAIPVIGFKVDSNGVATPPVVPARNARFGAACGGSPSTFYQSFLNGEPFDLVGLTLTPDNPLSPNGYAVTAGAPAVDATKVGAAPISTADDVAVAFNLGFNFNFPGGTTNQLRPCTNGYVWLNGTTATADFSPTVGELLGATAALPARLMPFWYDFNCGRNVATHPNSGMHAIVDTAGGPGNAVCYITWANVGVFNSVATGAHAVYQMQCVLYEATGVVEFRYGDMPVYCSNAEAVNPSHPGFVGFTRGRIGAIASVDPQSRDLSLEAPFSTSIEGSSGNIGQVVKATPDISGIAYGGRAYAGQSLTFDAVGVPAGAALGVQLLDFAQSMPGQSLPTITAPGCVLSTSLSPTLFQVTLFPLATVVGTAPVAVPAGVEGFELIAQYVVLDGLFGGPNLVSSASNAVRITVGKK
jgi:hypothetical protein